MSCVPGVSNGGTARSTMAMRPLRASGALRQANDLAVGRTMNLRLVFRILYVGWALPCLALSVWLAQLRGGHPPPIVLVPVVAAVWLLGHLVLWATGFLLRRGVAVARDNAVAIVRWPWIVIVAIVGSGVAGFVGLLLLGRVTVGSDALSVWTVITLVALLLHAPCFVGLLVRRAWARYYAAVVSFGWVALMVLQVAEQFRRGNPIASREWLVVLTVVVGFSGLGWMLLRSRSALRYFVAIRSSDPPAA